MLPGRGMPGYHPFQLVLWSVDTICRAIPGQRLARFENSEAAANAHTQPLPLQARGSAHLLDVNRATPVGLRAWI